MPRSDSLRPNRQVRVGDQTFTLAINGNAWATYEEVVKGGSFYDALYKLLDVFRKVRADNVDESKLTDIEKKKLFGERMFAILREIPMKDFRALLYATMADKHPELDLLQVGRMLDIETMWPFMMSLAGVQSEDAPPTDEVEAAGLESKGAEPTSDPTSQDQGPVLVELPGS